MQRIILKLLLLPIIIYIHLNNFFWRGITSFRCICSDNVLFNEAIRTSKLRVFENRMVRKTFGLKRDEVTSDWKGLHNGWWVVLYDLYSSPNIILVIKSGTMKYAEHVARLGDRRSSYRILVGRLNRKSPLW